MIVSEPILGHYNIDNQLVIKLILNINNFQVTLLFSLKAVASGLLEFTISVKFIS